MKSLDAPPPPPDTTHVAEPPVSPELFVPIGPPDPALPAPSLHGAPRLSHAEREMAKTRAKIQRASTGHVAVAEAIKATKAARLYRPRISDPEMQAMVDTTIRELREDLTEVRARNGQPGHVKNLAVAFGVMVDKRKVVSTPSESLAPLDLGPGELARRVLIRRLLALEPGETGTAAKNQEQP